MSARERRRKRRARVLRAYLWHRAHGCGARAALEHARAEEWARHRGAVAWIAEEPGALVLWAGFDAFPKPEPVHARCILSVWSVELGDEGEAPVIEGAALRVWEGEALCELRGELSAPRGWRAA